MRYVSKCIPKQMRLQPLPENVCTEQRISEVVRQRVPGHRTGGFVTVDRICCHEMLVDGTAQVQVRDPCSIT